MSEDGTQDLLPSSSTYSIECPHAVQSTMRRSGNRAEVGLQQDDVTVKRIVILNNAYAIWRVVVIAVDIIARNGGL